MPTDQAIRAALALTPASPTRARIIDITTTGRRTGRPRRIEIFFYRVHGRYYLNSGLLSPPSWYANLRAHPEFVFHLKNGVRADLRAHARPVTDPQERLTVFTAVVDDLNQPSNPGTIAQPTNLADWLRTSRLVEVTFPGGPA
ncbi:nitroreductase/quinone reductase family protein [Actinoplanes rectilineatus]|uniref:nitroreductase/quinone reductase family protein n=1 Tax=Actinoplanes rectilineatus TaxID=113571 RepID=UPI0005F29577|nr:nitroreductase/quinone reductase family protein [Actinoplanes rectilineatus]